MDFLCSRTQRKEAPLRRAISLFNHPTLISLLLSSTCCCCAAHKETTSLFLFGILSVSLLLSRWAIVPDSVSSVGSLSFPIALEKENRPHQQQRREVSIYRQRREPGGERKRNYYWKISAVAVATKGEEQPVSSWESDVQENRYLSRMQQRGVLLAGLSFNWILQRVDNLFAFCTCDKFNPFHGLVLSVVLLWFVEPRQTWTDVNKGRHNERLKMCKCSTVCNPKVEMKWG